MVTSLDPPKKINQAQVIKQKMASFGKNWHLAKLLPVTALVFFFLIGIASAQALEKSDDIDTNRPSFCQSALTVPDGSIQIENGTLYQHFQHGLTYFDVPENQVRLGLLKHTEFQMFTPNMVLFNQGASTYAGTSGLGEVGFKKQIGPYKNLTASVVAGAFIPTGSKLISGTSVQPVIRIPYSIQLNKKWAFCGMQSIVVSNSRGDIQYQPFVMLTRTVGSKAAVFGEYGGFFQQNVHAAAQQIAHFGGVYKVNRHNQVDLQFGFGMSKTAPAAFVGVGYSYRFDGLPWGDKKPSSAPGSSSAPGDSSGSTSPPNSPGTFNKPPASPGTH
jgi:hypothetical protein